MQRPVGFDKNVLGDLFRIFAVPGKPEGQRKYIPMVPTDKGGVGAFVSPEYLFYEFDI